MGADKIVAADSEPPTNGLGGTASPLKPPKDTVVVAMTMPTLQKPLRIFEEAPEDEKPPETLDKQIVTELVGKANVVAAADDQAKAKTEKTKRNRSSSSSSKSSSSSDEKR